MNPITTIFKGLTSIFSNPKVQKILIYVVIALVILYIISRSSERAHLFIKKLKPPKGDNLYSPLSDTRKAYVEDIGDNINTYLDANWYSSQALFDFYGDEEWFQKAADLPDNELYYLSKYYSSNYGKSLYKDVDEELMNSDWTADTDLLQRLEKMNLV